MIPIRGNTKVKSQIFLGVMLAFSFALTFALAIVAEMYLLHQSWDAGVAKSLSTANVNSQILQKKALLTRGFLPTIVPHSALGDALILRESEKRLLPLLSSYPSTPSWLCDEGYGLITYQTDRFGFRNPDSAWDSGRPDVVLVGDSYGIGSCVPEYGSIAGVLREHLNVVNLSQGSNNPAFYAATIRAFEGVIRPRHLVLVIFGGNDFEDGPLDSLPLTYAQMTLPTPYVQSSDSWLSNGNSWALSHDARQLLKLARDRVPEWMQQEHSALVAGEPKVTFWGYLWPKTLVFEQLRILVGDSFPFLRSFVYRPGYEFPQGTRVLLDTAEGFCRESECELSVLYLPGNGIANRYFDLLRPELAKRSISLLDGKRVLESVQGPTRPPRGGHYSISAYQALGRSLLSHLRRNR